MGKYFTIICSLLPMILCGVASVALSAEKGSIEAIHYVGKRGRAERIEFHLQGDVEPRYLKLGGEKPRLVFDFIGAGYPKKEKRVIKAGGELVQKIRVGIHADPVFKTRVVMDLEKERRVTVNQTLNQADNIFVVEVAPHPADGAVVVERKAEPLKEAAKIISPPTADVVSSLQVKQSETEEGEEMKGDELAEGGAKEAGVNIFDSPSQNTVSPSDQSGTAENVGEKVILQKVTFESSTNDKEMVLFTLSGFYPPVVFATEETDLRVVCDFLGGVVDSGVEPEIDAEGKYIKKVRIVKYRDPEKVRVVLDLATEFKYDLKQVFFKEDNLFVVIISNLGKK